MADEFKAENDGFQYTPGDEAYDPNAIDDVTDIFHDGYGADDDPTGDLSAPESREGGIGDAAATVQQTLAKAGGAAAGAATAAACAALSLFFYTDKKTAVIGLNFISVCKRVFIANNTVIANITIAAGSATD